MVKLILSITIFICSFSIIVAQSNPAQRKMEKVNSLLDKNKIDKAEEELVDLLNDYPTYGKAWDLLAKIHKYQYNESKSLPNLLGGNITVTTKDKDGNKIESEDSLATELMNMLNNFDPSIMAYDKWLNTLRKATFSSNNAYGCSITLRNELRAIEVDTLISTKALKYFNKAEAEFANKNYNKAAELYKRSLEYQPDFYKANLYLADSYYFMKNYTEAITNFKECAEKHPQFLEPRKYLVDAYMKEGLNKKALNAAIASMLVYPDPSIAVRLEDLVYGAGNKLNIEWRPRPIFPNVIDRDTARFEIVKNEKEQSNKNWSNYRNAIPKIEKYCNDNGIVNKTNALTSSKYLEVYSWEEMLKNSDETSFFQVKKIQEKGFLDCYVLITCFHDDFYEQYHHFVTNNKEKVKKYFETIIVSR